MSALDGDTASLQMEDRALEAVRSGPWWQAFTGLAPVVVMVPVLLAHAYAVGVVIAAGGSILVVAYHLRRRQGITSLDVLAAMFAGANVVLYLGFDSTVFVEHLDVAFYTLLAVQALASLVAGTPWTTQFTRRTVLPDLWHSDAFRAMNTLTTRLWAVSFLLCDAAALVLSDPSGVWVPVCVLVATAALSRRLGRRSLGRALAADSA